MARVQYNSDLLNVISDVKAGGSKSLELKVSGSTLSNKTNIENALAQWRDCFNTLYSPSNKCRGKLELRFKKVKRCSSENVINLKSLEKNSSLAEVIHLKGAQLGIHLTKYFIKMSVLPNPRWQHNIENLCLSSLPCI